MKIQKLNWAGLKLECGDKTILIDAVENFKPYFKVLGSPLTPLFEFMGNVQADYILFTHLHLDHFDVSVIEKCLKPDGKIIGYQKHEKEILKLNYNYILLDNDEVFEENGIAFKSVYSLDGIGEEQTAWVVSYQQTKIFHGGDTIWHNQFWRLGKDNEGINYAFLPINGAVVNFQIIGLQYSTIPASLTPEQAFNAAKLLHASTLIPIHFGKFATPFYEPTDTSEPILNHFSKLVAQPYQILNDGEYLRYNQVVNATKADFLFICQLFEEAILFQKNNQYLGWDNYDKNYINADIENSLLFKIVQNSTILCIFSICYTDPLIWRTREKGDAMYLHRIVLNRAFKGEKAFQKIVLWAIQHAKEKGLKYLRMDTWADNEKIIAYYQSYGFTFIENYTTANTDDLPIQHRNLKVALLELALQ